MVSQITTDPQVRILSAQQHTPQEIAQFQIPPQPKRTRVVITGLGAITPLGHSPDEFWQNLLAGKSGIGPVTLFDASKYRTRIAGEVKEFDATKYGVEGKDARRMGRATLFALAAGKCALVDAGFPDGLNENERAGVLLGTALGGFVEAIEAHNGFLQKGPDRLSPFLAAVILPNMPSFYVANYYRARGYNSTVVTACAAGTHAVGAAAEVIRRGDADIMLTGGTDAVISEIVFAAFGVMKATTTRNDEPTRASRPFDKDRDGFVIGEGSAVLVLEKLEHAQARGAKIYAEVLGYATNSDAFHFAAPDPKGTGATAVIRDAIQHAGISAEQVDYINAHGTSTALNDAGETLAIKNVFRERAYKIPISSTKSMIGHSMGAAGAFEAVACVMTIRDQKIHPTVNYETPDPVCDLDYVPNTARAANVNVTISNSFGLGGQNACLVLGKFK